MHGILLGQSYPYVFEVEHEQRVREANRQRLLVRARSAMSVKRREPGTGRGFIPRLAGALGLL
jgi:hypothetical protein